MLAVAGLCGPVIFVMCDIGAEMMMEVMVSILLVLSCLDRSVSFSLTRNFHVFFLVIVQWSYFVLGSMRTVVHSLGMYGHILRVSSIFLLWFMLVRDFWEFKRWKYFVYLLSWAVYNMMYFEFLRWRIQHFPSKTSKWEAQGTGTASYADWSEGMGRRLCIIFSATLSTTNVK